MQVYATDLNINFEEKKKKKLNMLSFLRQTRVNR